MLFQLVVSFNFQKGRWSLACNEAQHRGLITLLHGKLIYPTGVVISAEIVGEIRSTETERQERSSDFGTALTTPSGRGAEFFAHGAIVVRYSRRLRSIPLIHGVENFESARTRPF